MLEKKRNPLFDNLRVMLIILVVYGHVIEQIRFQDKIFLGIYNFIYLFHMPLFVFCSGAFAKGDKKKIIRKYLVPYIVFQTLYGIFDVCLMKADTFYVFESYYVLWYLLALAVWNLFLPFLVTKGNMKKQTVFLVVSVLLGLLAGYIEIIGKAFSLSRIFVFFPFFLAGYYIKQEGFGKDFIKVVQKLKERKIVGFLSLAVLLGVLVVVYLAGNRINTWALYGYTSYAFQGYTVYFRILQYIVGVGLGILIFLLVSGKKIFLPFLAKNTMAVYLLHVPIIKLFEKTEIFSSFTDSTIERFVYSLVMTVFVIGLGMAVSLMKFRRTKGEGRKGQSR